MGFTHQYGQYNIEGTINKAIQDRLTANGLPAWMPSARLVFDWSELQLLSGYSGHAFSFWHMNNMPSERFMGMNVISGSGQNRMGQLDVSCWISKQMAGGKYMGRVRQMQDMVSKMLPSAHAIPITDVYASTASPTQLTALIRLKPVSWSNNGQPDPDNPDLIRARGVISYWYTERV